VSPLERSLLWIGASGTFVTGAVYAWMKYVLTSDDPYAVVHHPLQPWMLKLHILFAPVLVFAIGLVFTQHIWKRWRTGGSAGRRSGLTTLLTALPMVASGYLIQTVTGGPLLTGLIVVHLAAGTVYAVFFFAHHRRMNARIRRRRDEAEDRLRGLGSGSDEEVA